MADGNNRPIQGLRHRTELQGTLTGESANVPYRFSAVPGILDPVCDESTTEGKANSCGVCNEELIQRAAVLC